MGEYIEALLRMCGALLRVCGALLRMYGALLRMDLCEHMMKCVKGVM